MDVLQKKIKGLPLCPGCYIFKNKDHQVIYIGKSKALRNRVKQYFQNVDVKEGKYRNLTKEIRDVEFIIAPTERDALLLECKLIKEHLPKYNTQLKKTKIYPYIRIDTTHPYPTISITTHAAKDGCHYFGCFYNEDDAIRTIELINQIWSTPICCKDKFPSRPCLNFHLKKCQAPCIQGISQESYGLTIKEVIKCLNGCSTKAGKYLNAQMKAASQKMDFEKAAYYRDIICGLEKLERKSRRLNTRFDEKELFLFFHAFNEQSFSLFYIKDGITLYRADFPDLDVLDDTIAINVLQNIKNKHYNIENDQKLTEYLLAIYADKYYVRFSGRSSLQIIHQKLIKAHRDFSNPSH